MLFVALSMLALSLPGSGQTQQQMQNSSGFRYQNPNNLKMYLDSARHLAKKAPLRAVTFVNKAIEECIKTNDLENQALSYLILGDIQQGLSQHDMAIENYMNCIESFSVKAGKKIEKKKSPTANTTVFNAYKNISISYLALGKLKEAETYIDVCLGIYYLKSMPTALINEAKRVKAEILLKKGKSKDSKDLYEEVLQSEQQINNINGQVFAYNGIGKVYQAQGNEEEAISNFNKAKSISEKNKLTDLTIQTNDNLANSYRKQKKVDKEVETRNNTIELNNSTANYIANTKENVEIGNAYLNVDQVEQATNYYDKGVKSQQIINFKDEQTQLQNTKFFSVSSDMEVNADAYKTLALQYEKKKDFMNAAIYFSKYAQLQDTIRKIRKKELDEALAISASIGKNQQRIDLLEQERQLSEKSLDILKQDKVLKEEQIGFKNYIIISLLVLVILMMGTVFFIIKSSREKKKVHQLLALKSLRGQMNPHFIFNALNSVNHYVSQNDERQANRYLSDFSRLMRLVMDSSKHDLIPLTEELEMLRLYLQLENSRFSDKFDYKLNVSSDVEEAELEIPPMLIQPYLENAVWHGLRYIDGKGLLEMNIELNKKDLLVTITDNGIGRKKSAEVKTQNQRKQTSLGMQNIENRIKIMNEVFHNNITVLVEDAFPNEQNCGTKVSIRIPQKNYSNA